MNKDFFKNYQQHMHNPDTRKFLTSVAAYYEDTELNKVCYEYSFLQRYCIFRKTTQISKQTLDQFEKMAKAQYNKDDRFEEANMMESLVVKVESEKGASKGRVKKIKARVILRKKSSDLKGDDIENVIPDLTQKESEAEEKEPEVEVEIEEKSNVEKEPEKEIEEKEPEKELEKEPEKEPEEKPKIKLTGKKIKITKK